MKMRTLPCLLAVLAAAPPGRAAEPRPLGGKGTVEASGATAVPGGEGLLFVDDGQPGTVTWMRFDRTGQATLTPVDMGGSVVDPEGITNDGTWIYVVGSQSRGGRKGADLARFRFDPHSGTASAFESLGHLPGLVAESLPEPGGKGKGKARKAARELNIEGLAWDAANRRLLLGLRAPLVEDQALVVPLAVGGGPLDRAHVKAGPALQLDLEGTGVRSLEQAPEGGYLLIAGGVAGASAFRLLSWDGSSRPRTITTLPSELKPEGVVRVKVGGRLATVVLGDSGRYLLLD